MALHRDIYWVGRQWAVTGTGIQACDQKQKGKFDIEAARLWEDGALESVRALQWLNIEDFEKAVSVARKYYPEPLGKVPPPTPPIASRLDSSGSIDSAAVEIVKEPAKPVARRFDMLIETVHAKFVPMWRVRSSKKQ
jgi:hypothetical protein